MATDFSFDSIHPNRMGPPLPPPIGFSQMAGLLKRYFGAPAPVVVGMHHGFPEYPPMELGYMLLAEPLFPGLPKPAFEDAFRAASFPEAEIQDMLIYLYPPPPQVVNFTVQGNQSWQFTGVTLLPGEFATIRYTGGTWFVSPDIGYTGADGSHYYIAQYGYPLPGYHEGGLIARLNEGTTWVGSQADTPFGWSGELFLVMNDDINNYYGSGLYDNQGALDVEITIRTIII
jgi:hypothetical protein